MRITTLPLICLLVLASLVRTHVNKEYDDPDSSANDELISDYESFELDILSDNFKRPKGTTRFLILARYSSCVNRCGEKRRFKLKFCHCDHLCALYQDCCIDYWEKCNITTKPFNHSSQAIWSCVDGKYRQSKHNSRSLQPFGYMMITHCPTTNKTTNHSALNCLRHGSDLINIPVIGDDGRSYRNRYCAECHGIRDVRTFWGLQANCFGKIPNNTKLDYHSEYLQNNCSWYYALPNTSHSSASYCLPSTLCKSEAKTPETAKYKDTINKCKSYMELVYCNNNTYKNFHCAVCNGFTVRAFQRFAPEIARPSLTLFFDYGTISEDTPESGESSDDVIQGYLTTVGLSLSIVCLSLVVVTYVWFPKLRTVPGLVLLTLSLSLLAYQALLLASPLATSPSKACKGVAVSLHFMILSAFSWMTIMSYDVAKTFAMKGKSSGRSSSSSAFRRYLIVAISIPTGIVALSFTFGETNAMDIDYGKSKSCWIGQLWALIGFFYIPVGIMLLFNAIALTWTIISIRKVTKLTKNVQKSTTTNSRGQNAKIYSKLSTVMGITWFLGFGVTHSVVVSYLYVIFNSLQGVFIFVTFVLNKRTMSLWRHNALSRGEPTSSKTCTTSQSRMRKNASISTNQLHPPNNGPGMILSLSNVNIEE